MNSKRDEIHNTSENIKNRLQHRNPLVSASIVFSYGKKQEIAGFVLFSASDFRVGEPVPYLKNLII